MGTDLCNHTSASVLVQRDGKYALADRVKFPFFKAPSAGHVDEYPGIPKGFGAQEERIYREAAARELGEEFGLRVRPADLRLALQVRMDNACRRQTVDGGPPWHLWRVYTVTVDSGQQTRTAADEAADLGWYAPAEISALNDLEPVWRDMLKQIGTIR